MECGGRLDARYDGHADWYDGHTAVPFTEVGGAALTRLLGEGSGRCLDLCCGTGIHLATLRALGWQVTGVDVSRDQLRLAAARAAEAQAELVLATAEQLPFADDEFDAVVSLFSHTDVDDFAAVLREAARVLRPGGVLVYVGIHPCFVGPHSTDRSLAVPILHPGYSPGGRYYAAPGISPDGLRAKVGATHIPLGQLMQTFLDTSFRLERCEEDHLDDYPRRLAIRACLAR